MKTIHLASIATFTLLSASSAYDLHEWGTFTTVSGSDGTLLSGLEREEEALPAYVRHHPGFAPLPNPGVFLMKKTARPVRSVTVKMETPVIYFHSEEGFRAHVKVGFNGGTISQWYPERSGGETFAPPPSEDPLSLELLDFSKPYTGSIEWDIEVLNSKASRQTVLFKPDDLLQWTRARIPEANVVQSEDGTTEGFLFYRGVGHFVPGLHTTIDNSETLTLENRTGGAIPYLLVYEREADGTTRWFQHDAPLGENAIAEIPQSKLDSRPTGFDTELYQELTSHLTAQGLLPSEAEAMVQTWWHSYFEAPGLRVFWILPESRTEAILPLNVTPAPDKQVRVIVGRSEVLRPRQEREWLRLSESESKDDAMKWNVLTHQDRFGLAYRARVESLRTAAKR